MAFAEKSDKVTIVDLDSNLSVEVGRIQQHGMTDIKNNLHFYKIDGNHNKGKLVMFDYAKNLSVFCDFNL